MEAIRSTPLYRKYLAHHEQTDSMERWEEFLAVSNGSLNAVMILTGSGQPLTVGDADFLKQAPGEISPLLLTELATIPPNAHIWAVTSAGLPPLRVLSEGNLANVGKMYASIESSTLWVDLKLGFQLHVAARCDSEKSAAQIDAALRALAGIGRLSTRPDQKEMLAFYDSLDIRKRAASLTVTADFPLSMVDRFLGNISAPIHVPHLEEREHAITR